MNGKNEAFGGWPSGDCKPLLELNLSPDELEAKYRLRFKHGRDDLDHYNASHFLDPEIGPVLLQKHVNAPALGTLIYIDSDVESQSAIRRLIDNLELCESDILWRTDS